MASSTTPENSGKKTWHAGTLTYTTAGLVMLFIWLLLGDFVWSMRDRSIGPLAQWYLKHLNVSNLLYTLILITFPAALSLILTPVISYKSDRHRGRLGRRIPYLLATTPIAAAGMVGIGLCPFFGPMLHDLLGQFSPGVTASTIICFGLFYAMFEFGQTATEAVFGGLINDIVPKEFIGRFFGMFRAISLLDGILFNALIFGHVDTSFTLILCTIGIIYGAVFMWVCFKVKEGQYPPPPPHDNVQRGPIGGFMHSAKTYVVECFTNRYYVSVFILLTLGVITFSPVNSFNIPFARSLDINMETYGRVVALSYIISFCLSYFIGWMADVFHPIRVCMIALGTYACVTLWASFFARTETTFLIALVCHAVSSGFYFTSAASLRQRLFPHSRFAQFASAAAMLSSVTLMGFGPLVGLMIDSTGSIYRYAYTASCVLAVISLIVSLYVYAQFKKLGGVKDYVAPE